MVWNLGMGVKRTSVPGRGMRLGIPGSACTKEFLTCLRRERDYTIPRVQECLSLRPNWLSPPPLPQASARPLEPKGGGTTRLRVRVQGEQIRTTGEKA